MTVISYYGDGYQAEGIYTIDLATYTQGSLVIVSIPGLVSSELLTIPDWAYDDRQYFARWSVLFNGGTLLSSSSLRSSALPSYILGSVNIVNDGYVTEAVYLNYLCQRIGSYACWTRGPNYRYPHKYNPSVVGAGDIFLQIETLPSLRQYGKELYFSAPNIDYADSSITILYTCIVSSDYPGTGLWYSNF